MDFFIREMVGSLVTDGTRTEGQGNALLAKIATAQAKLERGSFNASRAALEVFLNHIFGSRQPRLGPTIPG